MVRNRPRIHTAASVLRGMGVCPHGRLPAPLRATSEQPIPVGLAHDDARHKSASRVVFNALEDSFLSVSHNVVKTGDGVALNGVRSALSRAASAALD